MFEEKHQVTRRNILQVAGGGMIAATAGPLVGAEGKKKEPEMPIRPLGKTGYEVPILSMGGEVDYTRNLLLLRMAHKSGVSYWDTAVIYAGGNSERGIGKYFEKLPKARKKIFLATKSTKRDPSGLSADLEKSLQLLQTDYVELFMLHIVNSPKAFSGDVKNWAEKAKKSGKIKLFGFSTHKNMTECLTAAAKAGWIDMAMTTYNYRMMDTLDKPIDKCHKAGMGLVAIKTQAKSAGNKRNSESLDGYIKRGFTEGQAKLKTVWKDERISSVCSQMPNVKLLKENVAAAKDKTELSAANLEQFRRHARATCGEYCAACGACQRATGLPIPEVMRYLMYDNSYGRRKHARQLFARLGTETRARLAAADLTAAAGQCPNGLDIPSLVAEAFETLA